MDELLIKLLEGGISAIQNIACDKNTSPEILKHLSTIHNDIIKECLACNSSTPPEVLTLLMQEEDVDGWIKASLASNPSTPPETLTLLATKYNYKYSVSQNPSASPELLVMLSEEREDIFLLTNIVRNPSTPSEILKKLTEELSKAVNDQVSNYFKRLKNRRSK